MSRPLALGVLALLLNVTSCWVPDEKPEPLNEPDGATQRLVLADPAGRGTWTVDGTARPSDEGDLRLSADADTLYVIGFLPAEGSPLRGFGVSAERGHEKRDSLVRQNPFRLEINKTFTRVEAVFEAPPNESTVDDLTVRGVRRIRFSDLAVVVRSDGALFETDGTSLKRLTENGGLGDYVRLPSGETAWTSQSSDSGFWVDSVGDGLASFWLGSPPGADRWGASGWAADGPWVFRFSTGPILSWRWEPDHWVEQATDGDLGSADWRSWYAPVVDEKSGVVWTQLWHDDQDFSRLAGIDPASGTVKVFSLDKKALFLEFVTPWDGAAIVKETKWKSDHYNYQFYRIDTVTGASTLVAWLADYEFVAASEDLVLLRKDNTLCSWVGGLQVPQLVPHPEAGWTGYVWDAAWTGTHLFWPGPSPTKVSVWEAATGVVSELELPD